LVGALLTGVVVRGLVVVLLGVDFLAGVDLGVLDELDLGLGLEDLCLGLEDLDLDGRVEEREVDECLIGCVDERLGCVDEREVEVCLLGCVDERLVDECLVEEGLEERLLVEECLVDE